MEIKIEKPNKKQVTLLISLVGMFLLGMASGFYIAGLVNLAFVAGGLAVVCVGTLYSKPFATKKNLAKDTKAVSPVIAVILMVAITVVLAATVFVLVSDIGGQTSNTAPQIAWAPDESKDRLGVNSATQNADWSRLNVSGPATVRFALNADATSSSPALPQRATTTVTRVQAGDYLDFCGTGVNVEIIIKDETANTILVRHTFTSIQPC